MKIRLKKGAKLDGVVPEVYLAIGVWHALRFKHGCPALTITSLNDGRHMTKSRHYTGQAFDSRIWDIPPDKRRAIVADARKLLDPLGFDVVSEETAGHGDHDHVELDIKPGEGLFEEAS